MLECLIVTNITISSFLGKGRADLVSVIYCVRRAQ